MRREEMGDLMTFLAVAEERSFTRAAARLGTSQSAVSAVVRRLEERLDVRLLTRTTRSVTPTEAGNQLVDTLRPAFDDIEARLGSLNELRSHPGGHHPSDHQPDGGAGHPHACGQRVDGRIPGCEHRDHCRSPAD